MRLEKLSGEERGLVARLLATRWTVRAAIRKLKEEYPESFDYSYQTFIHWKNSAEGRGEIQAVLEEIRGQVRESPYVHRADRLAVLQESLDKILERLRATFEAGASLGTEELVKLSAETRALIREIREEASIYDLEAGEGVSPYARLQEAISSIPEALKPLVLGSEAAKPS